MLLRPLEKKRDDVGETNAALIVGVEGCLHLLELCLCGAMAQAPHEDGELTGRDGAFVFLVEDGEEFLIVNELFLGQSLEGGTFHHFLKYYSRVLLTLRY